MTIANAAVAEKAIGEGIAGAAGQSLLARLQRGEQPPLVYFLEIEARRLTFQGAPEELPFGAAAIGEPLVGGAGFTEMTSLLLSDREWAGRPDDPGRPNRFANPCLISAGDFTIRAPIFADETRRTQTTIASARLIDDGFFTEFLNTHTIDQAPVSIFFGEEGGRSDEHVLLLNAIADGYSRREGEVELTLKTAESFLDTAAQVAGYTGLGGEGGDAPLAGSFIDLSFGEVFNVPARREESAINSYRPHAADIEETLVVKDNGAEIAFDGRSFETYAEYRFADDPALGFYSKGPQSRVRLGDTPTGVVTIDLKGSKLFGAYSASVRNIVLFLMTSGGAFAPQIDSGTIGFLPNDEVGVYISGDNAVTKEDVLNALLAPYLAWVDTDSTGHIGIARLQDPSTGTIVDDLTVEDILPGWRVGALSKPPLTTQRFSYNRNFEVLENPAGALDEETTARLQREEDFVTGGDAGVKAVYPSAKPGPDVRTFIKKKEAAQAAADYNGAIFNQNLGLASVPVPIWRAKNMRRGSVIGVTHPELTNGERKGLSILQINPRASQNQTEIVGLMRVEGEAA